MGKDDRVVIFRRVFGSVIGGDVGWGELIIDGLVVEVFVLWIDVGVDSCEESFFIRVWLNFFFGGCFWLGVGVILLYLLVCVGGGFMEAEELDRLLFGELFFKGV